MASLKLVGVMAGLIILAVGLVGSAGLVPELATVTVCTHGYCSSETLTASFVVTVTSGNLTVPVRDTSTLTVATGSGITGERIMQIVLDCTTGGRTATYTAGGGSDCTYATAGTYTISETVTADTGRYGLVGTFTPATFTASTSDIVTVSLKGGPPPPTYQMVAGFSWSIAGDAVSVRDASLVQNVTSFAATLAWGDGDSTPIANGGSASHTFAAPAAPANSSAENITLYRNYTLAETETGLSPEGSTLSSSADASVEASWTFNATCPTSCSPPPPVPPPPTSGGGTTLAPAGTSDFNAVNAALVLGGLFVILAAVMPGSLGVRVLLVVAGVVVGFLVGYAIGGLGPLL